MKHGVVEVEVSGEREGQEVIGAVRVERYKGALLTSLTLLPLGGGATTTIRPLLSFAHHYRYSTHSFHSPHLTVPPPTPSPTSSQPGVQMYAYEVDGLGHSLADFDDPNLPSLLAIPLLGYEQYNHQVGA